MTWLPFGRLINKGEVIVFRFGPMRTALRRLERAGVAPRGEKPVAFDMDITGDRTILLLTDRALYFGAYGRPGGRRIGLDQLGAVSVEPGMFGVGIVYRAQSKDGQTYFEMHVRSPEKPFLERMQALAVQLT